MESLRKNVVVAGVLTAEVPDTSGETLEVKGADISSLKTGNAPINTEHVNPEDLDKKDVEGSKKGADRGFNAIVGRVIDAKKIFSEQDCDNDLERKAWEGLKVPLIFGYMEFFDSPDHPNAQAASAIIRQAHHGDYDHMIGFSVEGNVLKRDGGNLKETVIRRVAATAKPCNKAAVIQAVLKDSASQDPKPDVVTKASQDGSSFLTNFNNQRHFFVMQDDFGLSKALRKLRKTISAGGGNAAPSTLTQGAALQQSSSHLDKLEQAIGSKPISRKLVSDAVPGLGNEQVGNVIKVLRQRRLTRYEKEYGEIYDRLFKAV